MNTSNQRSRYDEATGYEHDRPDSGASKAVLGAIAIMVVVAAIVAFVVVSVLGGDDTADAPDLAVVDNADVADTVQQQPAADAPESDDTTGLAAAPAPGAGDTFGQAGAVELGVVGVVGAPLGAFDPAVEDTAVGTSAPAVTASSLRDGSTVSLEPGTPRVLAFFAHWCEHCQAELPELVQWLSQNDVPPSVELIGVSTVVVPERDNYPPSAWFNREGWPAEVLVDDGDVSLLQAFGFNGFPAFIAIDAEGKVVRRASGNIGAAGFAELVATLG